MVSTLQRFKAAGVVLGLAIALAGCVTTGGAGPKVATHGQGTGYVVCSGGHASRFPDREAVGQVCRPSASLSGIF
jgi:hypothetical protein